MDPRALAVATIVCAAAVAIASPDQTSVWSGVYTDAQAEQGAAVYKTHCVSCHGDSLSGGEQVPALRGVTFGATWESVPLADLFERMRKTMPPGKSGVVTRQEYANVLAYVLKMNSMPAGSAPLPSESTALASITFQSNKP
jgi:mono/diheme cytochrome c family protein